MPIFGMGNEVNWIAALAGRNQARLGLVTLRKSAAGTVANIASAAKPVAVDTTKMSVRHILITKSTDLQGDIVDPAGADLATHQTNPVVFYDHREHYKHPIGKADDGTNYTVCKSRNGELLYADTFFSPKDEVSNQLFGLVAEDMIRGWSVGFDPKKSVGAVETIRKSQGARDRGAFRFNEFTLLEYSLTPQPVNPEALTILVEKGRFGAEPLNEIIKKSLSAGTLTRHAAKVTVPDHPLTTKSMPNDPNSPAPEGDPNADPYAEADGEEQGPQETPTVASLYDAAQGIMDICSNLEQSVAQSEHKGGKSFASQICAVGQKLAAKIKGKADAIKAELAGEESEGDEEGAGKPKGDGAEEDDEMETDDEGSIKTKGGYKPKRWTTGEIAKANYVPKKQTADPAQIEALKAKILGIYERLPAA